MDSTILLPGNASRKFLAMVFSWLFAGLLITSACIYGFNTYRVLMRLIFADNSFTGLAWLSLLGPFALSAIIRRGINQISFIGLSVLFALYAALIGICFSFILLEFVDSSLFGIFAASCLVFGITAIAGYRTQTDLTQFKPISWMLLSGIIVVTPIVFLLPDLQMQLITTYIGVIVFIGIAAFHFQSLKETGAELDLNDPSSKKMVLLQALKLYVDFVNLFFFIVVIFVRKRD